jgi:Na+-translocating ferredoxin:NAD+ oxidoreductase RnfG subunit
MRRTIVIALVAAVVAGAGVASAHITPPVVLASDRESLSSLLAGAQRFFVREVRLGPSERAAVQQRTGWAPDEDFYRFYLGRDGDARLVAAAVFVSDFTIHGPVRVAVAVGADRTVRGVRVVEVTEETYGWIKPLIDADFSRQFIGHPASHATATVKTADPMSQFYAQVIAGLVRRGAALLEVGALQ